VTARAIVQAVLDGRIDVGPLDAWWHELLKLHEPETTARLRTVATTATVPAPPLVAAPGTDPAIVTALRRALLALPPEPALALQGYAVLPPEAYGVTLAWAREALERGYPEPA
jgi:ABC-type phosphate/phosphonate transport system substrate-binding protein